MIVVFAASAFALLLFLVAATRPAEVDVSEQTLLAALVAQELSRPVYDAASGMLLDPALVPLTGPFMVKCAQFEEMCRDYESKSSGKIPEDIRMGVLQHKISPILLLDEITAHLDEVRKENLFSELLSLESQFFISGTEVGIFNSLSKKAKFLELDDRKKFVA